ncbi:ABC1 domain-containing protein [Pycnococcus provasolii]
MAPHVPVRCSCPPHHQHATQSSHHAATPSAIPANTTVYVGGELDKWDEEEEHTTITATTSNEQQQQQQQQPQPTRKKQGALRRFVGRRRRQRLQNTETRLRDIGFQPEALQRYYARRPTEVARRAAAIASKLGWARRVWINEERRNVPEDKRTRGAVLRSALSALGPVFVKAGQTLAQRPDLVGDEAADALRRLQEENAQFDDALAFQTIADDLSWDGPLAPNHWWPNPRAAMASASQAGETLFAALSPTAIASASLGQVYKATTHDGRELAVKVMRPRAIYQVALDYVCWTLALKGLRRLWKSQADLSEIATYVGECVWAELDYHEEAANAAEFRRAHNFLGFVTAPEAVYEYTGPRGTARVLSTLWVHGSTLSALPTKSQRVSFARMATEACVCQLVFTGFVHCDPHEGNLLMVPATDGEPEKLCFLDFGLVSRVEPHIMEGFARGVRCMIGGDYRGLVGAFRDVGFTPADGYYRRDPVTRESTPCEADELADAVRNALEGESGGTTRFGALATGLGSLSTRYRFLTPPYIVLLCRTFLTLEGLASKADPEFNIYLAALPYAVRRALAPATKEGSEALRNTLLDESNRIRWARFQELVDGASASSDVAFNSRDHDDEVVSWEDAAAEEEKASSSGKSDAAGRLMGLFGSIEGKPLRAVTRAADSIDLAKAITGSSATARSLRESGTAALASYMTAFFRFRKAELAHEAAVEAERSREAKRSALALKVLAVGHLRNLANGGLRGVYQLVMLVLVGFVMLLSAFWRVVSDVFVGIWSGRQSSNVNRSSGSTPPPPPVIPAVS